MQLLIGMFAASGEHLQYRPESDFGYLVLKALLVTVVLLGLVLVLLLLAKRAGWLRTFDSAGKNQSISILASRRVTPHTTVLLVRIGDAEIVLTESSRSVTTTRIGEISIADEVRDETR